MNSCKGCKTQECQYIELEWFLKYLGELEETSYSIVECPDKSKKQKDYTCDLVIEDKQLKKTYIEIKEVRFGYNKKKFGDEIAENRAQVSYASLIDDIIDGCATDIRKSIDKYVIQIPREQKDTDDEKFRHEFKEFLNVTDFDGENSREFSFVRRYGNKIKIHFEPKPSNMKKVSNRHITGYQYQETGITLETIQQYMTDPERLSQLIIENCESTSSKKFPNTDCRKILLNILKVPLGYNIFFDQYFVLMAENLKKHWGEFKSAADEVYLVYYDDGFTSGDYKECGIEPGDELLFILPLSEKKEADTVKWKTFKLMDE